jgi:hypothetical protein
MATTRSGKTVKVSISIDKADLAVLKRRARESYRGNLSAAFSEAARLIRQRAARTRLIDLLGGPTLTAGAVGAIDAITVPADAVAKWWRGPTDVRRAILDSVDVEPLTLRLAQIAGEAMRAVRGATLVDAIVVASASVVTMMGSRVRRRRGPSRRTPSSGS